MVEYKLTVIKLPAGGYQVGHYHKVRGFEVPTMQGVIDYMHNIGPSILEVEPVFVDLNNDEVRHLDNARKIILTEGLASRL